MCKLYASKATEPNYLLYYLHYTNIFRTGIALSCALVDPIKFTLALGAV